jgi:hypothetical protein
MRGGRPNNNEYDRPNNREGVERYGQ